MLASVPGRRFPLLSFPLLSSPLSSSVAGVGRQNRWSFTALMVFCQSQNTWLIFILSKKPQQNPTSSVPGCQPTTSCQHVDEASLPGWCFTFLCVFLLSYNLNRFNATNRRRLFVFLPPALSLIADLKLLLPPSSSTPPQEVEVAAPRCNLAVIPHDNREWRRFPLATMLSVTSVHMCTWRGGTRQRREAGFALWCNITGPFFLSDAASCSNTEELILLLGENTTMWQRVRLRTMLFFQICHCCLSRR